MKKFFVAVMMVLAVVFLAGQGIAAEARAKAEASASDAGKEVKKKEFNPPTPYGHQNGIYWLSKALYNQAGGTGTPQLIAKANKWKPIDMTSYGDYYVAKTGVSQAVSEYCFSIGNDLFIPHALLGNSLVKDADVKDNGLGGYNFLTSAVK